MSIRGRYEVEYPRQPQNNNNGGCLSFGFIMKWLAALGLGAGSVTMVVIAITAVITFVFLIVMACILCGFMGAMLEMLSNMPLS